MKVLCKRTYFVDKPIGDKKEVLFKKNKTYSLIEYDEFVFTIKTESSNIEHWSLTKKNFIKYFFEINEIRDNKINEILN